MVARYLRRAGYQGEAVADRAVGLERALADPPDLLVFDLMLPTLGGLELCHRLGTAAPVPVIMLTARGEEADRIAGLELVADDYMAKPFSPRELTARVRAVLRRAAGPLAPVRLVALSCLGAAVTASVVSGLLFVLRGSPVGVQVAVAALAPVLAVALGVGWAASQMFLTSHDLWVVLVGAGTVGLVVALLLGRRVAEASASVGAMARRLGERGPGTPLHPGHGRPAGAAPHELMALAGELEQTSLRLAQSQAQAAALERSRRQLVSWVSHDLRTPLAGIRAMVEVLEDRVVEDPGTVARYHRTMRPEADHLAGLVNDLFELSRIHAGSVALDLLSYRGDVARTPRDGGAGLGLAVAWGQVEAHRGRISVRNEGEGCRFTVSLPTAPPAIPPAGSGHRSCSGGREGPQPGASDHSKAEEGRGAG